MGFAEDVARHAEQIRSRMPHISGEQATKQSLVVPFFHLLGYDVFDPREVRPEYVADFAVKKQGQFEKVDYAIYVSGGLSMFVECKPLGAALEDHGGQLARYFNATPSVRVAMITDGVRIRVFSDLQQPNIMDQVPWLDVDMLSLKSAEIDALRRFRKADFSASEIVSFAEEMVFYTAMLGVINTQLREPSESFVRWVAGEIPAVGRVTARVVERLTPVLRRVIQSAIVDHVARSFDRTESAASVEASQAARVDPATGIAGPKQDVTPRVSTPKPEPSGPRLLVEDTGRTSSVELSGNREGVVTTTEELEAYDLIARWIREVNPGAPLAYRDARTYFTVHQANLRKWFVRLGLERKPFWVAFRHVHPEEARRLAPGQEVAEGGQFGDTRIVITGIDDLHKLRAAIIAAYHREAARADTEADGERPGGGARSDTR